MLVRGPAAPSASAHLLQFGCKDSRKLLPEVQAQVCSDQTPYLLPSHIPQAAKLTLCCQARNALARVGPQVCCCSCHRVGQRYPTKGLLYVHCWPKPGQIERPLLAHACTQQPCLGFA
uniref:Uncharacterized protein n=1 Tax=Eutreptiella gymnastica TaxID=73025 RepID=A0A7S4LBP2_9EUGL